MSLSPGLALAARDLNSATQVAVSQTTLIAKSASVLGVLVGAVLYNVPGANQWAQRTLVAGLIGALASFGGPAFVELIRSIFGG